MKYILSILLAQSAGFIGSLVTPGSISTWYTTITKPAWNPPSWIFGPVWITLYTLMGIAAVRVYTHKDKPGVKLTLAIYGVHLVLNALWSILFFGFQNPGLAFGEIIILLALIIITTIRFYKVDKVAALLMLPYIGWVAFASILNGTIWYLN